MEANRLYMTVYTVLYYIILYSTVLYCTIHSLKLAFSLFIHSVGLKLKAFSIIIQGVGIILWKLIGYT